MHFVPESFHQSSDDSTDREMEAMNREDGKTEHQHDACDSKLSCVSV